MKTVQLIQKMLSIPCMATELRLDITLQCGQSFRWKEVQPGFWRGVIGHRVWTLTQDDTNVLYQVHEPQLSTTKKSTKMEQDEQHQKNGMVMNDRTASLKMDDVRHLRTVKQEGPLSNEEYTAILNDYFQMHIPLEERYHDWSKVDHNFSIVSPQFPGVRMLKQDPVENVFSFICSSNNNIVRISQLVEKLCRLYGTPLIELDNFTWYAFPSVTALCGEGVEQTLREQGFGYRAKFIHQSAKIIEANGGEEWLYSLRDLPYPQCHEQLTTLTGVGAKVADCICLMSMGHLEAIPVDTHVFQIAARDYLPELQSAKTVTDRVYQKIAEHFRSLFGELAGWAHSVLFSADLKKFEALKGEERKSSKSPVKQCKATGKKKDHKEPVKRQKITKTTKTSAHTKGPCPSQQKKKQKVEERNKDGDKNCRKKTLK
ncbi:8-oxoguanine DNA glycosylase [Oratosquilla oratoria]|uniref:8-oxoguanine DNA glycosylase n=1 Tax=Oratosquilla oratoria TaxID=337810 RepID=UPI003F765B46